MLVLQVLNHDRTPCVVHAQYSEPQSSHGGHLSSIYPGGSFMGFSFEKLCELGSGEHPHAAIDPYDFRNTGTESKFASDWESRHAHFQFVLFGYQVGAYTSLEVLAVAREVLAAQRGGEA